jgi:N-acyl-D-amino-acid deacylase
MSADILIKNGRVIDGSGSPGCQADLVIEGDRIADVGSFSDARASRVIDAAGLVVTPGFIDIHTHAEFNLVSPTHHRTMEPFVRQGITTMITGNCGASAAPLSSDSVDYFSTYFECLLPEEGLPWDWVSFGEFLEKVEDTRPILNMGQLVGHGTVRLNVMGFSPKRATADELASMRSMVRRALEEGSMGISYGLGYIPGLWAPTDELIEVARDLQPHDGHISVHLRGQTVFLEQAVDEMIAVAETVGVPLQLSHFAPFGEEYLENFFRAHGSIEKARARGVEIGYDLLTYATSSTTVLSIYPMWMFEGGLPRFFALLREPDTRERIVRELKEQVPRWPSWETGTSPDNKYELAGGDSSAWGDYRLHGFRKPENREHENRDLATIADSLGKDILEALFDLTIEEEGKLYYSTSSHDDEDLDRKLGLLFALPEMSCMTDSVGIGLGAVHPSVYGVFPRLLGRHVREWKTLSLEDAVRKCTSLPASQMGIADRGTLRRGFLADVVIFDPDTVIDTGSFANPHQYPVGIETVITNGVPVWHEGVFDHGAAAGRVLRPSSGVG